MEGGRDVAPCHDDSLFVVPIKEMVLCASSLQKSSRKLHGTLASIYFIKKMVRKCI